MKKLITIIIIIIACIIAIYISYRIGRQTTPSQIITQTDTIYIKHDSIIYSRCPLLVWGGPATRPDKIDTVYVVDDYYTRKIYNDSVVFDSLLNISICDTIEYNQITGRSISYKLSYPIVTNTITTIKEPKPLSIYLMTDNHLNTSVLINYKRIAVSAGYSITDRSPILGVGLKLY